MKRVRRRQSNAQRRGAPEYMTTYGDMVTLLLCFFVLLFAFSEVDAQKFQAIIKSFQGSLGVLEGGKTIDSAPYVDLDDLPEDLATLEEKEAEDFRKLKAIIEEYAKEKGLETKVLAKIEERGLVIRILDNVFFDSGKAVIKKNAKEILAYIGEVLKKEEFKDKHIKIEGHTDNDPIISSNKFPTNWELSAIRATNVLRFLVEDIGIEENRISSAGYSYYRPIVPNDTSENKAKNRRVDVVILKSTYAQWEPN
ncbi:OmpA/MotB family protein [Caldisalinibacter kiritimatiensis]|uniref:Flagellar motor rotation protein MotB n=1 Tax=Caldisalinibacter kiritimatiensis TaxID=1304284 RepID=R1CSM7_9FIRM|nr:flagellar motor protein MotB [Caldisalinibacter kiritimatiensis]EOC99713.1 Flagellar motor rotation protein MotB [Caldisalinibacter kiritimatiensis]